MHALFFGAKRVHIETVRLTNRLIQLSALTAARFDLMRVVQMHPEGIHQSTLRWLLGVTAPVVSRMLSSLQELGFVEREADGADRRCKIVRLSHRGQIALRVAKSATLVDREADRTAARAATGDTSPATGSYSETDAAIAAASQEVAVFDSYLLSARHALFDRAPYHHPWQTPPFTMPVAFAKLAAQRMHTTLFAEPRARPACA
jgi:DNA-binding MarR family transcriptional regulator